MRTGDERHPQRETRGRRTHLDCANEVSASLAEPLHGPLTARTSVGRSIEPIPLALARVPPCPLSTTSRMT